MELTPLLSRALKTVPTPSNAPLYGMGLDDALGGKLLHVLIDFRGQSAKFIHAHGVLAQTVASVRCPTGSDAGRTLISIS